MNILDTVFALVGGFILVGWTVSLCSIVWLVRQEHNAEKAFWELYQSDIEAQNKKLMDEGT